MEICKIGSVPKNLKLKRLGIGSHLEDGMTQGDPRNRSFPEETASNYCILSVYAGVAPVLEALRLLSSTQLPRGHVYQKPSLCHAVFPI